MIDYSDYTDSTSRKVNLDSAYINDDVRRDGRTTSLYHAIIFSTSHCKRRRFNPICRRQHRSQCLVDYIDCIINALRSTFNHAKHLSSLTYVPPTAISSHHRHTTGQSAIDRQATTITTMTDARATFNHSTIRHSIPHRSVFLF